MILSNPSRSSLEMWIAQWCVSLSLLERARTFHHRSPVADQSSVRYVSQEESLCAKYGVRGYPTVKYFTSTTAPAGDVYEGARDIDSLKAFADETLGPSCSAATTELCNEEETAVLEKFLAMVRPSSKQPCLMHCFPGSD